MHMMVSPLVLLTLKQCQDLFNLSNCLFLLVHRFAHFSWLACYTAWPRSMSLPHWLVHCLAVPIICLVGLCYGYVGLIYVVVLSGWVILWLRPVDVCCYSVCLVDLRCAFVWLIYVVLKSDWSTLCFCLVNLRCASVWFIYIVLLSDLSALCF